MSGYSLLRRTCPTADAVRQAGKANGVVHSFQFYTTPGKVLQRKDTVLLYHN
jgi:hypothetical protein